MAENPIENFYDSRGIRLDVYVKDSGRIFNIEIQTGNYDDLILRARYYLSLSDVATTNAVGVCPRCNLEKIKKLDFIIAQCYNVGRGYG